MDTNLSRIWEELERMKETLNRMLTTIQYLEKKYSPATVVDLVMNAARKVVDAAHQEVMGYVDKLRTRVEKLEQIHDRCGESVLTSTLNTLGSRIEGLQASVENLEDKESEMIKKVFNLNTRMLRQETEFIEENVQEYFADNPRVYELNEFAPEPESRHGEMWNDNEQEFLQREFDSFLAYMAKMTGRKPGSVFYRVRDKIVKKQDVAWVYKSPNG